MERLTEQRWLRHLGEASRLARASRWRRLMRHPLRYLSATLYTRLIYPWHQRGWPRRAHTFFDLPMEITLPAGQDIYLLGAKGHDSEIRLARYLIASLKPGQTFVDVGAHYGFFSLLAATLVGPDGQVLALEASPDTFKKLTANLQPARQARPVAAAAGATDGTMTFYEFPPLYSEYNSVDLKQFASDDWLRRVQPHEIQVPCRRLDTLLAERQLQPDLIKIDVEGAEALVIDGLEGLLKEGGRPAIAMEYLRPERGNDSHQQALQQLHAYGYRTCVIDQNGHPRPCPNPEQYLIENNLDSDNLILIP